MVHCIVSLGGGASSHGNERSCCGIIYNTTMVHCIVSLGGGACSHGNERRCRGIIYNTTLVIAWWRLLGLGLRVNIDVDYQIIMVLAKGTIPDSHNNN
eukprot:11212536-Lingulodinium_polyedra.AAC.2